MRTMRWLSVMSMVGLVAFVVGLRADDKAEKITPDKLPQKIKDTVQARLPGAEIISAEKEKEEGKVVYDLELKHEGRKYEMDILEDGTLVEIEKEIAAKDVPEKVTKAIKEKYPTATVKEVMEVNKVTGKEEKPMHYEVTIETGGKSKEVIVSLDGKLKEEKRREVIDIQASRERERPEKKKDSGRSCSQLAR
jgi:uncharacterized membrane protein YkoI